MDNSGWIKIHRSLKDKAFYLKDSEKVHLWVHLLLCANHNEREEVLGGKPIKCKPGQFTTGRKQLSQQTGINESKVERILEYFEKKESQIEQQKSNTNRLISICKWDEFQNTEQQVNNDRTTSEQQVNNERTTTEHTIRIKELKNKRIKEENNDVEFLYNLYPSFCKTGNRSTSKSQKDKNKIKLLLEQKTFDELKLHITNYVENCEKSNTYLKNFSSFLNQLPEIVEIKSTPEKKYQVSDAEKLGENRLLFPNQIKNMTK